MKTLQSRILVAVDMEQKELHRGFQTAKSYQTNYRDRHPVLCEVIEGNHLVRRGLKLLVHHNFFYEDSPFRLSGNVFALNTNENIFARLDDEGNPHSMFGNVMAERIPIEYTFDVPAYYQKSYADRAKVISDGCGYRKGQTILIVHYADYEIVYNWEGEERRVIKIKKEDIVGVLK